MVCPAGDSFQELMKLCRAGRLYEVEAWIRAGKSIEAPTALRTSPLVVAVDQGFHSLVELLVSHGADPHANGNALVHAVRRKRVEIARLLLCHGADVRSVRPWVVCQCSCPEMVGLFMDHGADLTEGNAFADALAETGKAMFGVFRDRVGRMPDLQRQADIALRYCCEDGRFGGVCRLLWLGANPRAKVPSMNEPDEEPDFWMPALDAAVTDGHCDIVKRIGVDPSVDDPNHLLHLATFSACGKIIRYLVALGADINHRDECGSTCLVELFRTLHWSNERMFSAESSFFKSSQALGAIHAALELGAKWERGDGQATRLVRLGFYALSERPLLSLLEAFRKHGACSDAELIRLLDTPRMVRKLERDLKPFVKTFPGWRRARERHAEVEEKKRMGRWRG